MKTLLLLIASLLCLWFGTGKPKPAETKKPIASLKPDTLHFAKQVQPIFQQHCNPCHFPGGKMYEKLPFDQGTTIAHHLPGIMKRIKQEDEVATIKRYVEEWGKNN
jgi:hypothetical protein